MELDTFNQFLSGAVNIGASDIHFKVGSPPAVRVAGTLKPVRVPALQPEDTEQIASHVLEAARFSGELDRLREFDASYALEGVGRFRAAIFRQMGHLAIMLRVIPLNVPTLERLGLPAVAQKIAGTERGLVLVTGATGMGKTSTLAAIVDHINKSEARHIITIEDPVEYVHQDATARITQREVGPDTASFRDALRSALRQDPDVILVGEMRDLDTMDIAIKAAETGHLVLSTMHTIDVGQTVSRIVGTYPPSAQTGVRLRLSEVLAAVISQRLVPRADGQGRALAAEIMVSTIGIQEAIRNSDKTQEIEDILASGHDIYGTQTFDQHLAELFRAKIISMEEALEAASNPSDFERAMMLT